MIKFFVGQRVRMIATDNEKAKSCVGQETRIVAEFLSDGHYEEAWDLENGWSVAKRNAGAFIAPILPDGHRSGDYTLSELLDRCKQGEGVSA